MKNFQLVRAIVATATVFATGASSFAQGAADTRALKDYVPVLKSAVDRAWAVDPKKGVETRKVGDGVFVVTDGVWQRSPDPSRKQS